MFATLYEALSKAVDGTGVDDGRTEETKTVETIDKDRISTAYLALSSTVATGDSDDGRTEQTRETPETTDNDRVGVRVPQSLLAPPTDLYATLGGTVGQGANGTETAMTASTETMDWDRPAHALLCY